MSGNRTRWIHSLAVCAAIFASLYASTASAVLRHRYTFNNGNANDSVGTAHGTVVDAGAPTHVFTPTGLLDLSANTGESSNGITNDAYVDLPNGIISQAAQANGAITLEWWASVTETHTWQRFGDFGTSNGGENTSPSGTMSAYILISPNSGRWMNGLEMTNHPSNNAGEPNIGTNGPFPLGVRKHVVAVYDHNNTSGGTNPNGTMALYLDGAQILPSSGTGAIHPDINLRTFNDNNNWLGRSQWPDPVFDGSYDEFRIYDHALSSADVSANFQAGPVPVPEPEIISLVLVAGAIVIRRLRRGMRSPRKEA